MTLTSLCSNIERITSQELLQDINSRLVAVKKLANTNIFQNSYYNSKLREKLDYTLRLT